MSLNDSQRSPVLSVWNFSQPTKITTKHRRITEGSSNVSKRNMKRRTQGTGFPQHKKSIGCEKGGGGRAYDHQHHEAQHQINVPPTIIVVIIVLCRNERLQNANFWDMAQKYGKNRSPLVKETWTKLQGGKGWYCWPQSKRNCTEGVPESEISQVAKLRKRLGKTCHWRVWRFWWESKCVCQEGTTDFLLLRPLLIEFETLVRWDLSLNCFKSGNRESNKASLPNSWHVMYPSLCRKILVSIIVSRSHESTSMHIWIRGLCSELYWMTLLCSATRQPLL